MDDVSDPLRVLVVGGGDRPSESLIAHHSPKADVKVAVDGGAEAFGLLSAAIDARPDVVIGDLDSISPRTLSRLEEADVEIFRHPVDKDASDLELALAWVERRAGDTDVDLVALGLTGGRLDHELVSLAVIAGWAGPGREVLAIDDDQTIVVVTPGPQTAVPAAAGATVTLLAIGGDAHGVTTHGLRWPLDDATLTPHSSLGLSNVADRSHPMVSCTGGRLLAIVTTP